MSRQFLNTDSSRWREGFGKGSQGDLSYGGGSFGGQAGHGFATFTGTSGAFSGTFTDQAYFNGRNGGRIGDIVLIHQSQLTGAGNWELNLITGRSGSTLSLKYPLQNNYTTGAQVVSSAQWKNLTFTGTTTPYLSWNGAAGGILFLVAKDTITINGAVSLIGNNSTYASGNGSAPAGIGTGFRGGLGIRPPTSAGSHTMAYRGEGNVGPSFQTTLDDNSNNGSGGGGRTFNNSDGIDVGFGGGNGTVGSGSGGGDVSGNAQLTLMLFGGGGGGGAAGRYNGNGYSGGGGGGGIVFLLCKNLVMGGSSLITVNGGTAASATGRGGGGAGGSVLLKCVNATLGSNKITASAGVGGYNGGVGRIHLDYSKSYSGSTSPGLDVRQDNTIKATIGGANYYQYFL